MRHPVSATGLTSSQVTGSRAALVTRASSDIGVATVQALAQSGVDLALALESEPSPHFMESLRSYGGRVVWFPITASPNGVEAAQLVRSVVAALGGIDLLVANTIRRVEGQIDDGDVDEDALDEQMTTDVRSVIALVKATSRSMRDGGRVVALGSSLADRVGTPGLADFAATRAAIAAFCRGAAHDLGPRGITVNVVQIGAIESQSDQGLSREMLAAERDANALGRLGKPFEVADAIMFLAGPGAAFITGTVINVDGGYSA